MRAQKHELRDFRPRHISGKARTREVCRPPQRRSHRPRHQDGQSVCQHPGGSGDPQVALLRSELLVACCSGLKATDMLPSDRNLSLSPNFGKQTFRKPPPQAVPTIEIDQMASEPTGSYRAEKLTG